MRIELKRPGGGIGLTDRAAELAKRDHSVAQVGAILDEEVKTDEFADIRRIMVADMRPDPEQPRELRISLEMLRNPGSVTEPRARERIQSILGLAETITQIGQQAAVEVYREGGHYTIVSGERRYWAARVANLDTLYAKVLPERPRRLRLKQYIENAQRDDLDTRETLKALQMIIAESARLDDAVGTWSDLKRLTGMSKSTASRWWAILSGPDDVREAINGERISSLTAAEAIARTADGDERSALLLKLERAEKEGRATDVLRDVAERRNPEVPVAAVAPRAGRPKKVIFGGTPNLIVARAILKRILGKEPGGIDWTDAEAISAAFRAAVQQLEEELRVPSGTKVQKRS
jgi:ParB/RepB/Spo0J family partition protein